MTTARPDFRFGHYHHHYSGAHMRRSSADNSKYDDNFTLPRLPSFHEPTTHVRPGNDWGYSRMPSIAQSNRFTVSQPPSPPASHYLSTLGQFPVAEDLHRWPQMFKINQVKRGGPKKQKMSCFFCRSVARLAS